MRNRTKATSKELATRRLFNWWNGLFFAVGLVAVLLYYEVGYSRASPTDGPAMTPTKMPAPAWGDLQYTTICLERPEESIPRVMPEPQPITWSFEDCSREQVQELIRRADFTARQKELLLEDGRWRALSNGCQILPSVEVVRDMNMSARTLVYSELSRYPLNPYIQFPFRFETERFEKWLKESGLSEELQIICRKLGVQKQGEVYFYDAQLLQWLCKGEDQKKLAKALSRTPTLLMKLRVGPSSDLDGLMRYWCSGSRGRTMRPFLKGMSEVPGGSTMSVSYFFSTFARMRLYTFPDLQRHPMAYQKNCFYTALNFFNETPEYKYLHAEVVALALKNDYDAVTNELRFGDLLALVGQEKSIIHMCVYIADDVVFTKNGVSVLAPWVLMRRTEMMKTFATANPAGVIVYRKKVV